MTNSTAPLRVLIIDDSALYRKIVRDVLGATPGVEVVGVAPDGLTGIAQINTLKPDLVTLDFEMPKLDGIGVLKRLSGQRDAPAAIMVSAFTASGAEATTAALQEGAFDFILKPSTKSLDESVRQLKQDLAPKLQAVRARRAPIRRARPAAPPRRPAPIGKAAATRLKHLPRQAPEIVAIAVSTGGPQALTELLPQLPANFPCPIVIVQHMPPLFTASLASDLNRRCPLEVVEGKHRSTLRAGQIAIAPGGKQMRVARDEAGAKIEITNDPPERNCKPSADYLMRSVASAYGPTAVGVVLTGMGDDGTLGAGAIKKAGGTILAQDEATCVVYGMPKSVFEAGHVDTVAPLNAIAPRLTELASRRALL